VLIVIKENIEAIEEKYQMEWRQFCLCGCPCEGLFPIFVIKLTFTNFDQGDHCQRRQKD